MIWQTILNFWFKEIDKKKWFIKNKVFDDLVIEKFLIHTERALNGRYDAWNKENNSRLALIILLDQMTRNMFRGSPKSFSGDGCSGAFMAAGVGSGVLAQLAHSVLLKIRQRIDRMLGKRFIE